MSSSAPGPVATDFEKLGVFYLGRRFDPAAGAATAEPYLYDSKDLTTHAVCAGMTGSGKTGLCLSLLEEAAIDGIPAIAIDPKGDVGNLLLTFPELQARDFEPWVDPAEARRRGQDVATHAADVATGWRDGLAQWGQDGARIARLRAAADFAIYTPGSTAGLPLRLLRSFAPPPPELIADREALAERIEGTVAGLVALLGVDADPLRSPEPILLAKILEHAWSAGRGLDLPSLIRAVRTPPFDTVGVFDLESFLPAPRRLELAMRCNHLLASPSFAAWLDGEPLEIGRLLHGADGRPRLSILSIAHLSESERMFFVTTLLNELVGWVRSQSGTSSLRALLYMDEIYGYFPPTAAPPTKQPMLTLLKQARASGLGIVLATQNPADLDYKGLANTGTWFLGRLQTERDKMRVLEGLEGAAAATGAAFEASRMEQVLAGLPGRVFLAHNVHEDAPLLFQTRWAMSYLRGPLTRDQIQRLMAPRKAATAGDGCVAAGGEALRPASAGAGERRGGVAASASRGAGVGTPGIAASGAAAAPGSPATRSAPTSAAATPGTGATADSAALSTAMRPLVPPEIEERFLAPARDAGAGSRLVYRPRLLARGRLHFVKAPAGIDHWDERQLLAAPPVEGATPAWESAPVGGAGAEAVAGSALEVAPREPADFQPLPSAALNAKRWAGWRKQLVADLYRDQRLVLWRCAALAAGSTPGESEGDFRARAAHLARERRDREIEALRRRFAPKLAALEEKIRRGEEKVKHEESQLGRERLDAVISIGTTLAGALFGRKLASVANVTRARSTMRGAGRASREQDDVARAGRNVEAAREDLAQLESDLARDVATLERSLDPAALELERIELAPRKTDVTVASLILLWTPWHVDAAGVAEPLYDADPSAAGLR